MKRNEGETQEYNPKWDQGLRADGWPRAIGKGSTTGRRYHHCPACGGIHLWGMVPEECLDKLAIRAEHRVAIDGRQDWRLPKGVAEAAGLWQHPDQDYSPVLFDFVEDDEETAVD